MFVTLPAALTQHFCEFKGSGDTVGTLTEGFVYNTVCGKKYQAQLEEQREYIKNVTKQMADKGSEIKVPDEVPTSPPATEVAQRKKDGV